MTHKELFFSVDETKKLQSKRENAIEHNKVCSEKDKVDVPPAGYVGEPVKYVKRVVNSGKGSGIDPNHTHFVLVAADDPKKGVFGGEIKLRAAVEASIRKRFKVPGVCLVVHGGPGTYNTVNEQSAKGNPVLLVKEVRCVCMYVVCLYIGIHTYVH